MWSPEPSIIHVLSSLQFGSGLGHFSFWLGLLQLLSACLVRLSDMCTRSAHCCERGSWWNQIYCISVVMHCVLGLHAGQAHAGPQASNWAPFQG